MAERDSGEISRGYVYRRGEPNVDVKRVELETDFSGAQNTHQQLRVRLHAESGETFDVEGRVVSLVPCRNRREGWVTRISEGMTEWRCGEHRGYGMSEYLDHLTQGT